MKKAVSFVKMPPVCGSRNSLLAVRSQNFDRGTVAASPPPAPGGGEAATPAPVPGAMFKSLPKRKKPRTRLFLFK